MKKLLITEANCGKFKAEYDGEIMTVSVWKDKDMVAGYDLDVCDVHDFLSAFCNLLKKVEEIEEALEEEE